MAARATCVLAFFLVLQGTPFHLAWAGAPRNLFANPGFELGGSGPWRMDKGGKTAARSSAARS